MKWSVSEAKAKLSEVLSRSKRQPQTIESHGEPIAVVVSKAEFDRLVAAAEKPKTTPMHQWLRWLTQFKTEHVLDLTLPPRQLEDERPLPFQERE